MFEEELRGEIKEEKLREKKCKEIGVFLNDEREREREREREGEGKRRALGREDDFIEYLIREREVKEIISSLKPSDTNYTAALTTATYTTPQPHSSTKNLKNHGFQRSFLFFLFSILLISLFPQLIC